MHKGALLQAFKKSGVLPTRFGEIAVARDLR
jgi:hypothetical protein